MNRLGQGSAEGFVSRLKDLVALGSEVFVERIRRMCALDPEYEGRKELRHRRAKRMTNPPSR